MRIEVKVSLVDDEGERFMGAGPLWLLDRIGRCGSIRQAAQSMDMSYAKAHRILGRLEERLGVRLLERRTGGADRGGANLTPAGLELLDRYGELQLRIQAGAEVEFLTFLRSWDEFRSQEPAGERRP